MSLPLLFASFLSLAAGDELAPLSVWGVELPVTDVAAAERRYADGLGFRTVLGGGEVARLEKDGLALVLVRSDAPPATEGAANVHVNLETDDLAAALERALAAGFDAPATEPFAIPIGRALTLVDPDGHRLNLIDLEGDQGRGAGLALFNVGIDLEAGADWEFVERLGLTVLTRAYVPDALPIARAGAAELVLHREARAPRAANTRSPALLLAADDLAAVQPALAARAFADAAATPRPTPFGRRLALRAPSLVRVDVLERSPAQAAYERLCGLAGRWEGKSSQGWTAEIEIEVIARGSAVLERSNFEAHPGETMLTLFAMDGPRLRLTHYCVAGNQPRLEATAIGADELGFTFVDGGNLASRDVGHMDEAVLRFAGPDEFSSRWSYFQAGQTRWMEEIHYRREPR